MIFCLDIGERFSLGVAISILTQQVEEAGFDRLFLAPGFRKNVMELDRAIEGLNVPEGFARQEVDRAMLAEQSIQAFVDCALTAGDVEAKYGIRKFAAMERLDPSLCPIRPCLHHSAIHHEAV
jgi:hypothetical protein